MSSHTGKCNMHWIRRITGIAALMGALVTSHAEDPASVFPNVPMTRDLAADGALVQRERLPLLLVFSQDHCDYCAMLDREVLNPNYATGAFNGKVIVRRFMIDSYAMVTDFDGKRVEASALASRLKVYATPTLLLVDAHGRELAQRMVGIDSLDFFSAYLDENIAAARQKLVAE